MANFLQGLTRKGVFYREPRPNLKLTKLENALYVTVSNARSMIADSLLYTNEDTRHTIKIGFLLFSIPMRLVKPVNCSLQIRNQNMISFF